MAVHILCILGVKIIVSVPGIQTLLVAIIAMIVVSMAVMITIAIDYDSYSYSSSY